MTDQHCKNCGARFRLSFEGGVCTSCSWRSATGWKIGGLFAGGLFVGALGVSWLVIASRDIYRNVNPSSSGPEEGLLLSIILALVYTGMIAGATFLLFKGIRMLKHTFVGSPDAVQGHKRRIWRGLLWIVFGGIATLITYQLAIGGYYLVFWGALVWGGIELLWGLTGAVVHKIKLAGANTER